MITVLGEDWLTAVDVAEQIGPDITAVMLRDWRRRKLVRGTVLDGVAHYPRPDIETAEARTRHNGRPRRAGAMIQSHAGANR